MFFGKGLLQGLGVTLKNFFDSFTKPLDRGGLFTVQYPEIKTPLPEKYRNIPFLVYDGEPEHLRCTACDICAKECPPKCIYIVRDQDESGKPLKRPKVFEIDLALCMNCGICEDVCPFDSIFMDHNYEITDHDRQTHLVWGIPKLRRSNDYFKNIRPQDCAKIDAKKKPASAPKAS